MMIKPSVAELLEKVDNRYELVIATSKRARQIAQGAEPLVKTDDVAPDSIAPETPDNNTSIPSPFQHQSRLLL